MDIEWAKDGNTGELFIVRVRNSAIAESPKHSTLLSPQRSYQPLTDQGSISQGKAHLILDVHKLDNFQAGEVLVKPIRPNRRVQRQPASPPQHVETVKPHHAKIIPQESSEPALAPKFCWM